MQNEKDYLSIKSLHDHLFKWGRVNPDDAGTAGDGHAGWAADGATYVGSAAHCRGSREGGNERRREGEGAYIPPPHLYRGIASPGTNSILTFVPRLLMPQYKCAFHSFSI
jgi:hypothetical protein